MRNTQYRKLAITLSILATTLFWSGAVADTTVGNDDREITLKNSCSFPVWWGYTGGSYEKSVSVDCAKEKNKCHFQIGDNADVSLTEIGPSKSSTISITNKAIPVSPGGADIKWSGNIFGAKGCKTVTGPDRLVCESVNCGPDGCTAYRAPSGVRTLAEFTLQSNAQDFYDVSSIPGVNIPIAMGPTGNQTFGPAPQDKGGSPAVEPSQYWCTSAGSSKAQGKLSACNWAASLSEISEQVPPTATDIQINLVTPKNLWEVGFTTTSCTSHLDCTSSPAGKSCGMWQEVNNTSYGPTNSVLQICGEPTGVITPNGYCSYAGTGSTEWQNAPSPWLCGTDSGQQSGGVSGTYSSLYECNSINSASGYQTTSKNNDMVCGCENWDFGNGELPVGQLGCQANNTIWQDKAKWGAQAVKIGCPTAYSFPFDDETSTFNCQTQATLNPPQTGKMMANATNYTIEFCPGGLEGGIAVAE